MAHPEVSSKHATWLGRPGTSYWTGDIGLRVVAHVWDDESTAEVRVVTGDGRRGTLVEHVTETVPADQVIESMHRLLDAYVREVA